MSVARRAVGVLAAVTPFALAGASTLYGLVHPRPSEWGLAAVAAGLFVAATNLYRSFVRPSLARGGTRRSGFPIAGTALVVLGVALGFGSPLVAALGVAALMFDPSGSPWFVLTTWKDPAFWDGA